MCQTNVTENVNNLGIPHWGSPTQWPHGESVIIPTVISFQLFCKVFEGIKEMGGEKRSLSFLWLRSALPLCLGVMG